MKSLINLRNIAVLTCGMALTLAMTPAAFAAPPASRDTDSEKNFTISEVAQTKIERIWSWDVEANQSQDIEKEVTDDTGAEFNFPVHVSATAGNTEVTVTGKVTNNNEQQKIGLQVRPYSCELYENGKRVGFRAELDPGKSWTFSCTSRVKDKDKNVHIRFLTSGYPGKELKSQDVAIDRSNIIEKNTSATLKEFACDSVYCSYNAKGTQIGSYSVDKNGKVTPAADYQASRTLTPKTGEELKRENEYQLTDANGSKTTSSINLTAKRNNPNGTGNSASNFSVSNVHQSALNRDWEWTLKVTDEKPIREALGKQGAKFDIPITVTAAPRNRYGMEAVLEGTITNNNISDEVDPRFKFQNGYCMLYNDKGESILGRIPAGQSRKFKCKLHDSWPQSADAAKQFDLAITSGYYNDTEVFKYDHAVDMTNITEVASTAELTAHNCKSSYCFGETPADEEIHTFTTDPKRGGEEQTFKITDTTYLDAPLNGKTKRVRVYDFKNLENQNKTTIYDDTTLTAHREQPVPADLMLANVRQTKIARSWDWEVEANEGNDISQQASDDSGVSFAFPVHVSATPGKQTLTVEGEVTNNTQKQIEPELRPYSCDFYENGKEVAYRSKLAPGKTWQFKCEKRLKKNQDDFTVTVSNADDTEQTQSETVSIDRSKFSEENTTAELTEYACSDYFCGADDEGKQVESYTVDANGQVTPAADYQATRTLKPQPGETMERLMRYELKDNNSIPERSQITLTATRENPNGTGNSPDNFTVKNVKQTEVARHWKWNLEVDDTKQRKEAVGIQGAEFKIPLKATVAPRKKYGMQVTLAGDITNNNRLDKVQPVFDLDHGYCNVVDSEGNTVPRIPAGQTMHFTCWTHSSWPAASTAGTRSERAATTDKPLISLLVKPSYSDDTPVFSYEEPVDMSDIKEVGKDVTVVAHMCKDRPCSEPTADESITVLSANPDKAGETQTFSYTDNTYLDAPVGAEITRLRRYDLTGVESPYKFVYPEEAELTAYRVNAFVETKPDQAQSDKQVSIVAKAKQQAAMNNSTKSTSMSKAELSRTGSSTVLLSLMSLALIGLGAAALARRRFRA